MYQELEHWKQYKQKKTSLMKSLGSKFGLDSLSDNSKKLVSDYNKAEFDKWMKDLITRNGTTEY